MGSREECASYSYIPLRPSLIEYAISRSWKTTLETLLAAILVLIWSRHSNSFTDWSGLFVEWNDFPGLSFEQRVSYWLEKGKRGFLAPLVNGIIQSARGGLSRKKGGEIVSLIDSCFAFLLSLFPHLRSFRNSLVLELRATYTGSFLHSYVQCPFFRHFWQIAVCLSSWCVRGLRRRCMIEWLTGGKYVTVLKPLPVHVHG